MIDATGIVIMAGGCMTAGSALAHVDQDGVPLTSTRRYMRGVAGGGIVVAGLGQLIHATSVSWTALAVIFAVLVLRAVQLVKEP